MFWRGYNAFGPEGFTTGAVIWALAATAAAAPSPAIASRIACWIVLTTAFPEGAAAVPFTVSEVPAMGTFAAAPRALPGSGPRGPILRFRGPLTCPDIWV